jgi:hypothetical protein
MSLITNDLTLTIHIENQTKATLHLYTQTLKATIETSTVADLVAEAEENLAALRLFYSCAFPDAARLHREVHCSAEYAEAHKNDDTSSCP